VGTSCGNNKRVRALQGLDKTAGIAGRDDYDLVAFGEWLHQRSQVCGWQIFQSQSGLGQYQLMVDRAVTGQIDEDQVFRAATFGQPGNRAREVFARGQRPVSEMVAVVDEAYLTAGGEAVGQEIVDIADLAQKHALLAITG